MFFMSFENKLADVDPDTEHSVNVSPLRMKHQTCQVLLDVFERLSVCNHMAAKQTQTLGANGCTTYLSNIHMN